MYWRFWCKLKNFIYNFFFDKCASCLPIPLSTRRNFQHRNFCKAYTYDGRPHQGAIVSHCVCFWSIYFRPRWRANHSCWPSLMAAKKKINQDLEIALTFATSYNLTYMWLSRFQQMFYKAHILLRRRMKKMFSRYLLNEMWIVSCYTAVILICIGFICFASFYG